jgi:hypothetical protein
MASKKTPQKQPKSDFIRSQPATLSTAEVVAKGKAAGVTILPGLVYEVRRTEKAKKAVAKKPPKAKPVVAVTKSSGKVSKADFVRARAHLSPKEIVEDAKAAGIKFEVHYVYRVRGYDKTAAKKKPSKATAPSTKPSAPTVKPTTTGVTPRKATLVPRPITTTLSLRTENVLKALGAELGLGKAMEILAGERANVMAVIGGG